jgi:hypothetical protein
MTKPHVSATQLDMYFTCPESYRRRYVEGETLPPGIALLVGSGTHRGAETNFRQKISSHADMPVAQIVDAAVAGFEDALAGGYMLSAEEQAQGAKTVLGTAKDQVAVLAQVHAEQQAPDYQPIAIEKEILIPFPRATHNILGYIDLTDDRRRVVDFKTAAKRKPQKDADESLQLTIYAASFQIDTGSPPAEVRLDTLVKTTNPARQVLTSQRGPADFAVLINRINVMLAAVKAGIFPPAPIGSWKCCPKWCGYFDTCPYVNHERRQAAESQGE